MVEAFLFALLIFGCVCREVCSGRTTSRFPDFTEVTTLSSVNGLLAVTLVDELSNVTVGSLNNLSLRVWNGTFTPPTLKVKPGDQVRLTLVNLLDQPTNIHFHGLRIQPTKPADDSLFDILPGTEFTYTFTLANNHPAGLFWYHSHVVNSSSEEQVFHGMSGGFIVEGSLALYPTLQNVTERILLLRDMQLPVPKMTINSNAPTIRLINGLKQPRMLIRPGETQVFTFANIGANIFYKLSIRESNRHSRVKHKSAATKRLPLYVLAVDGQHVTKLTTTLQFLLVPGGRVQFLIQIPKRMTEYTIETLKIDTGSPKNGLRVNKNGVRRRSYPPKSASAGGKQVPEMAMLPIDKYPRSDLGYLSIKGAPVSATTSRPEVFQSMVDLRTLPISANRTIIFSEDMKNRQFFINGMMFNSSRVDFRVKLGSLERWTIINRGDMLHTFHIHQGQYQVVSVGKRNLDFVHYEDSTAIPTGVMAERGKMRKDVPVTVLIPFFEEYQLGKYPFHCHILSHEDNGMMMVLEVVP